MSSHLVNYNFVLFFIAPFTVITESIMPKGKEGKGKDAKDAKKPAEEEKK
jgi:hypothetical protein